MKSTWNTKNKIFEVILKKKPTYPLTAAHVVYICNNGIVCTIKCFRFDALWHGKYILVLRVIQSIISKKSQKWQHCTRFFKFELCCQTYQPILTQLSIGTTFWSANLLHVLFFKNVFKKWQHCTHINAYNGGALPLITLSFIFSTDWWHTFALTLYVILH